MPVTVQQSTAEGLQFTVFGTSVNPACPDTSSTRSRETLPGRRITSSSPVQSTIVDSTPTVHGPSSRTTSTSSPRSARTSPAVVGLTCPKRFAEGAAMPPPNARSSASATGWSGTRTPTVSPPPVTASRTRAARRTTIVSGPGHSASPRRRAATGTSAAQSSSCPGAPRWTITGCSPGRPLTAYSRASAPALSASAPSPYTVSVGKATRPPRRSVAAAREMSASVAMSPPSFLTRVVIGARREIGHGHVTGRRLRYQ